MQQQGIYLIYVDMLRETGLLFCWTWCYNQRSMHLNLKTCEQYDNRLV